ncbi:hypothetical protein V6N13_117201 [Hibiscus sabdariffa]|uniref:TF-B3 domain-containing protein n=1 Tax=Hibiscus sabdariffa TaxID=183260 RepID=A0ABR2P9V0_9ROSI
MSHGNLCKSCNSGILSFSKACLEAEAEAHGNGIVLQVKDEDGVFWNFGYTMIARSRGLQEGDCVLLHKEQDTINSTRFKSTRSLANYHLSLIW